MRKIALFIFVFAAISCSQDEGRWQGYVEGEYVLVAPAVSGRLVSISVQKGAVVEKGSPVFSLDGSYEKAALERAEAQLESAFARLDDATQGRRPQEIDVIRSQLAKAKAQSGFSSSQLERDQAQFNKGTIPKARLDASIAQADADKATVKQLEDELKVAMLPSREGIVDAHMAEVRGAQAAVEQAEWNLAQRLVISPVSGLVNDVVYRGGEFVMAGSAVVRLLPPENIKVRFFVPQQAAEKLKAGDNVVVYLSDKRYEAVVSYISDRAEYTPPLMYSNDSRHRLVFMVECIPLETTGLNPGQPVEVSQ